MVSDEVVDKLAATEAVNKLELEYFHDPLLKERRADLVERILSWGWTKRALLGVVETLITQLDAQGRARRFFPQTAEFIAAYWAWCEKTAYEERMRAATSRALPAPRRPHVSSLSEEQWEQIKAALLGALPAPKQTAEPGRELVRVGGRIVRIGQFQQKGVQIGLYLLEYTCECGYEGRAGTHPDYECIWGECGGCEGRSVWRQPISSGVMS